MIRMRKGSMEYWPHRRAKRVMPRVRAAPTAPDPSFLGFVAFKAGMTHIMMIDDTDSPAKGTEVSRPVTLLEIPRVFLYGIRFYKKGYLYKEAAGEVYDKNLAGRLGIKAIKDNEIGNFKKRAGELSDIRALAFLDASNIGFGNKKSMRFEIPLGGGNVEDKLAFIEGFLGKELKLGDVLKAGEYVDITSITKGKGWQGVIKRFGVARQYRKATNKVRHVGTLGPWHPAKVMFGVPHSGHMGYNYRTERNKRVLKLGTSNEASAINIKGGFINYGLVKNDFAMVDGSVPGPAKRLLRIRKAIRSKGHVREPQITYISTASKQGA